MNCSGIWNWEPSKWPIAFFCPASSASISILPITPASPAFSRSSPPMRKEPSVTGVQQPRSHTGMPHVDTRKQPDRIFAEIRYEDDSGPQLFLITQNQVRIGRGADDEPMDLALYSNDEVSREHTVVRRDAA